jgi:hypothetical protein
VRLKRCSAPSATTRAMRSNTSTAPTFCCSQGGSQVPGAEQRVKVPSLRTNLFPEPVLSRCVSDGSYGNHASFRRHRSHEVGVGVATKDAPRLAAIKARRPCSMAHVPYNRSR